MSIFFVIPKGGCQGKNTGFGEVLVSISGKFFNFYEEDINFDFICEKS
jgi:hypothetical protein